MDFLVWLLRRYLLGLAFTVKLRRNPVLGAAFAGMVHAMGSGAKSFAPGEAVFGISGFRMKGHAKYLCIPATRSGAVRGDA